MKTLDEVIAELEDEKVFADALHYLKEYRDRKEALRNWTEKAISEQQNLSDAITFMRAYRDDKDDLTALRAYWKEQHENNALTWDELKAMEGKPVWVEWYDHKEWFLIDSIDKKKVVFRAKSGFGWHCVRRESETWQAYRKERS